MIDFFKYTILCISLISASGTGTPCSANEIDTSKWTYDDLTQAALRVAAQKDYERALKILDLAVKAAPNYPEGYINRGAVLRAVHQKEKAIQDEEKALSLAKSESKSDIAFRALAHQNLSGIYLNNKELAKAEEEASIAVKLTPTEPGVQKSLGDALEKSGKRQAALLYYKKAQYLYKNSGLFQQAKELDEKISDLESNNLKR